MGFFSKKKESHRSEDISKRNPKHNKHEFKVTCTCTCDGFYRTVKKDWKEKKEVEKVKCREMMEDHVSAETISKKTEDIKKVKSPNLVNPAGGAVKKTPVESPSLVAACSSRAKLPSKCLRPQISAAGVMPPRVCGKDQTPSESTAEAVMPAIRQPKAKVAVTPMRGIAKTVTTTEKQQPQEPSAPMATPSTTGNGSDAAPMAVRGVPQPVTMREKPDGVDNPTPKIEPPRRALREPTTTSRSQDGHAQIAAPTSPEGNSRPTRGLSTKNKTSALEGDNRPQGMVPTGDRPTPSAISAKEVKAPMSPLMSGRDRSKQPTSLGGPPRVDNNSVPPPPSPSAPAYASPLENYNPSYPPPRLSCPGYQHYQNYRQSYPDNTQSSLGYLVSPSPPSPYLPTFLEAFSDENANSCSVM